MLNIMDLEQQLINEIEERQAKLDKVRGVSPKLQALEILLKDCRDSCNEFGMQELFLGVLGKFTAAPTPQPQPQPKNQTVLTDKETKIIRQELKTFLKYEGQRLNDATIKNLLIEKLEGLNKTNLLEEVNLDDKVNFLAEAIKLIDLLTLDKEDLTEDKEDLTEDKEDLTPHINPSPAVEEIKIKEENTLKVWESLKNAIVKNLITGLVGTIHKDGVSSEGLILVKYKDTEEYSHISQLKLILAAPVPLIPIQHIAQEPNKEEEIKEEEIKEEEEEGVSDMTPQELGMWNALLAAGFTATELSAMATDKDTVEGFNSINGSSLTALPIPELYEYTMGVGRIE